MRGSRFGNLGSLAPKHRSRAGMWFAAFLIISLVMLLASRTEPALFVQRTSAGALEPVRSVIAGIGDGVGGLFGALGEIYRLRSENDALRSQLAGSQERIAELGEAAAENEELRDLLGIAQALDMDLLPVRITSRDPSNFTADVAIDAGTRDGLRDGMAVLGSAEGAGALAGTIVDVGPDAARVRFIVDTRSSVIALDQATRAMGLIQGQLGGQLVMVEIDRATSQTLAAQPRIKLHAPDADRAPSRDCSATPFLCLVRWAGGCTRTSGQIGFDRN